jgi:hypothetical protein
MQIVMSSPDEMRAQMQSDSKKWSDVIKQAHISIN